MSEQPTPVPDAGDPASLASRIARRRAALQGQTTKTFDVAGYKGLLAATYRKLTYTEERAIGVQHSEMPDGGDKDLTIAAHTLAVACLDVLEVQPDGTQVSLDMTWGAALADRLGIKVTDGANARTALFAIFADDRALMEHYVDRERWQDSLTEMVDETVVQDFGMTASSS